MFVDYLNSKSIAVYCSPEHSKFVLQQNVSTHIPILQKHAIQALEAMHNFFDLGRYYRLSFSSKIPNYFGAIQNSDNLYAHAKSTHLQKPPLYILEERYLVSLEVEHRFSCSGTLWKRDTFEQALRAWYPYSVYGTYYSFEFPTNVHPP